jgi:hypothetical protein
MRESSGLPSKDSRKRRPVGKGTQGQKGISNDQDRLRNRIHPAAEIHGSSANVTPSVKCHINVSMIQNTTFFAGELHETCDADFRSPSQSYDANDVERGRRHPPGVEESRDNRAPKSGPWKKDGMNDSSVLFRILRTRFGKVQAVR